MTPPHPDPDALAAARDRLPVLLYDGGCGFCGQLALTARRLARGRVRVEPLQRALADVPWVDADAAMRALHLVDRDGRAYAGAGAIVRLVRIARPWWGVLLLPYHLPGLRHLADLAYAAVAARRGTCAVPRGPAEPEPGPVRRSPPRM